LGLHPFAIGILAELIQTAATQTQVIVSTQSPLLLDHFTCEDVIVVNRDGDRSVFERLNEEDYNVWLEEYSLGELWQKNVVEGGPD
jgi:predicted ATPase